MYETLNNHYYEHIHLCQVFLDIPISLELVIKGQFCSCSDSLGGEEPNSKLAIYSPLDLDKRHPQISQ